MADSDPFLDFAGAAEVLASVGFTARNGGPMPPRTVETWANRGRLPFFKGPNGRRRIRKSVLLATLGKMQAEAQRAADEKAAKPRPAGRRAR